MKEARQRRVNVVWEWMCMEEDRKHESIVLQFRSIFGIMLAWGWCGMR